MADGLRDQTIITKGGLYTNEDPLTLAKDFPGSAQRLLNFEVSQFGGYRRLSGYTYYDSNNPTVPGAGPLLGIWIHNDTVYAARRNVSDATSATLAVGAVAVTAGSVSVTVTQASHGVLVGEKVTFSNLEASVGGLPLNDTEFTVASADTNTFVFAASAAASSTTTSTSSTATYTVSRYYSIYKHVAGVGWYNESTAGGFVERKATGVGKLRFTEHSFTGSEVHILVDGVNRPIRHNGAVFIEVYDRQGTASLETHAQLSDPFSYNNSTPTLVTVSHTNHSLAVGDTVRFSNVNVNIGNIDINNTDFTVTAKNSDDEYVFGLGATGTGASQNNVGGSTVNWFYTYTATLNRDHDTASLVTDFANHTFFAGMSALPNILTFSEPNSDLLYTVAGGAGSINVGFPITGLAKFRDTLYVFGRDKIKKITGKASSDFVLSEVTNNIGCIAADSIIEIGGDVLFLASDGIRPIQGTARIGDIELQTVSKPIQQILQSLPSNYDLTIMSSVVIRGKSQFRYFFPTPSGAQDDSYGIIGGLRFADSRVGWEFGELLGIRSVVAASDLVNNVELVVHGDTQGNVFKQETGNSFNGSDIISVYATPFYFFDSTERNKDVRELSIYTRPEGSSQFNLAIYYNWDDPNKFNPSSYGLSTAGSVLRYDTTGGTYGSSFTFGGSSSPVLSVNFAEGGGRSFSFVITSVGTDAPYSIQGWGIKYLDKGYK